MTNPIRSSRRQAVRSRLRSRDGERCWLCDAEMDFRVATTPRSATIEHLLSRSQKGENRLCNLVLCCQECNVLLDDKPLVEKIKLKVQRLLERKANAPS